MFTPAKCPSCSGALQVPTNMQKIKCMYCGVDIIVNSLFSNNDSIDKIKNLLLLANNATIGKNMEEAYKYYSEVLAIDANCYEAWFGRAIAAAWMSKINHPRIAESIQDINTGLKIKPDDYDLNSFAISFHEACVNVFLGFAKYVTSDTTTERLQNPNIWITFAQGALWCCGGIKQAHDISPNDKDIIENGINVTTSTIMLFKRARNHLVNSNANGNDIGKANQKMDATNIIVYGHFLIYTTKKQLADPNYKVQSLEFTPPTAKKNIGCLIILFITIGVFISFMIIVQKIA